MPVPTPSSWRSMNIFCQLPSQQSQANSFSFSPCPARLVTLTSTLDSNYAHSFVDTIPGEWVERPVTTVPRATVARRAVAPSETCEGLAPLVLSGDDPCLERG